LVDRYRRRFYSSPAHRDWRGSAVLGRVRRIRDLAFCRAPRDIEAQECAI
jgi:hypothetical protein